MKHKLLVFIVAYHAEKTIARVLDRVPSSLRDHYDVDVLIIDDASGDSTFEASHRASLSNASGFPITILFNPVNQGYGGNQKIGYHYAIQKGYDFVALIHGDGQYAPECLPDLLEPLRTGAADAVFGSRMMTPSGARNGGMPLYKFWGNKILTWCENRLLNSNLSEFHSGYRIYSTKGLAAIPFDRNTNDFHFDTEIIIQFFTAGLRIVERPIPTYYGDEICRVNGIKYGSDVLAAALKARLQKSGLFYDRKFDCAGPDFSPYLPKLDYTSPHSLAFSHVRNNSNVLDLGCAGGYMGAALAEHKGCRVVGVDAWPSAHPKLQDFYLHDLNAGPPNIDYRGFDYVLLLDVLEHLTQPEVFLEKLRQALSVNANCEVIVSTANIGFVMTRLMLLFGQFNYGKRGILDLTHTRLFTFSAFRRSIIQSGYTVKETIGVPGPFPLAIGDNPASRLLLSLNQGLISVFRSLFSYQIFMRIKPLPTLDALLKNATEQSQERLVSLRMHAGASGR